MISQKMNLVISAIIHMCYKDAENILLWVTEFGVMWIFSTI